MVAIEDIDEAEVEAEAEVLEDITPALSLVLIPQSAQVRHLDLTLALGHLGIFTALYC